MRTAIREFVQGCDGFFCELVSILALSAVSIYLIAFSILSIS